MSKEKTCMHGNESIVSCVNCQVDILRKELSIACARIQTLEKKVKWLEEGDEISPELNEELAKIAAGY